MSLDFKYLRFKKKYRPYTLALIYNLLIEDSLFYWLTKVKKNDNSSHLLWLKKD